MKEVTLQEIELEGQEGKKKIFGSHIQIISGEAFRDYLEYTGAAIDPCIMQAWHRGSFPTELSVMAFKKRLTLPFKSQKM